ncbi:sulfatase-like hydrolase/transferase, partial [Candidatus Binatia bacterium]|nr:sulfatase-like hydrolase/transferase [Candidatus Binatia bacterium]
MRALIRAARSLEAVVGASLLLALAGCSRSEPLERAFSVQHERPNILLLMAEDMSPRVGAFGDPVARTPHLDELAGQGTRFPNTFTTAGVCSPSRAAQITGVHQNTLGAGHMRTASYPEG